MVWQRAEEIWAPVPLPKVWKDVTRIANTIVNFEPVVMLCDHTQVKIAEHNLDSRFP